MEHKKALIVGAGSGLSASLARLFAQEGMSVVLAARNTEKLAALASEIEGSTIKCDVSDVDSVQAMFAQLDVDGAPDLVVYNPSARTRGPLVELDPADVERAIRISAFGGFVVAQEAVKRMLAAGQGTILFTGASASVKGYPQSSSFAMGKFALRGLAQSMARELQPKNIHVAHFVIDGGILGDKHAAPETPDSQLEPDAIAQSYLAVAKQHRSAWTWEMELRPWVERF